MRFANPWLLLLVVALPLWLWCERRSAQRGGLKFSSVATAQSLSSVWSALGPSLLLVLRGATLVLFVAALARPQLGRSESKVRTEGIDIVLVLDISGSMQAMDYEKGGQRQSRIDAAIAAGGRLLSDTQAPAFWVLADPEGNEACICTWQGRD